MMDDNIQFDLADTAKSVENGDTVPKMKSNCQTLTYLHAFLVFGFQCLTRPTEQGRKPDSEGLFCCRSMKIGELGQSELEERGTWLRQKQNVLDIYWHLLPLLLLSRLSQKQGSGFYQNDNQVTITNKQTKNHLCEVKAISFYERKFHSTLTPAEDAGYMLYDSVRVRGYGAVIETGREQ